MLIQFPNIYIPFFFRLKQKLLLQNMENTTFHKTTCFFFFLNKSALEQASSLQFLTVQSICGFEEKP
jgi:hypothetical protein